jgi:tRNA-dihydrouridine synthase C
MPLLLLAPMEGLLDCTLRDVLTQVGGIDRCVSEFIRVTGTLLPERAFLRIVPELRDGGRTRAGVPVRAQLLGSDPGCLAENAGRLAGLGPAGIDLNFGCPAKVVNRHGGGAQLLQEPELIRRIVAAVRRAVPAAIPVSAKMRLGFDDDAQAEDCVRAMVDGGACELVVHARTKADGYRPPAYWERIPRLRDAAGGVPVVANGEIWSVDDARRCRALSGCDALMLGRGMVADPGLALAIRGEAAALSWPALAPLMLRFWQQVCARVEPRHRGGRLKQWLNYLRRRYPEAQAAYDALRTVNDSRRLVELLFGEHFGWRELPVVDTSVVELLVDVDADGRAIEAADGGCGSAGCADDAGGAAAAARGARCAPAHDPALADA